MLPDRRYRKPPLIEVLADFYFEPGGDQDWDPKRLAQFTEDIKKRGYPAEENVREHGLSAPRGVPLRTRRNVNWPWRHRFASEDGNRTAQVGENLLVINQFPPYYGWRQFKQQTLECYHLYQQLWPSNKIAHVGLHYVDVVKVPGDSFFIDDYFNMYPVIPDVEGAWSLRNLAMSCETRGGSEGDVCSIAFHQRPSADPDVNTFRFRWDYVSVEGMTAESTTVESWLDLAHQFLRVAFRSTFTDKCEQLFDPEN
jgi:uncharacterized protein (TIGR04255 family)